MNEWKSKLGAFGGWTNVCIPFLIRLLNACVTARPSCCIVCMLGVGAVCEWPKKGRRVGDCDSFQLWSAEVSMPRGHGGVVAHFNMVVALVGAALIKKK